MTARSDGIYSTVNRNINSTSANGYDHSSNGHHSLREPNSAPRSTGRTPPAGHNVSVEPDRSSSVLSHSHSPQQQQQQHQYQDHQHSDGSLSTVPVRADGYTRAGSTAGTARQRRSKKGAVCVQCRQMKLKCDAQTKQPGPCTRCKKIGVDCIIDPTFRRMAKKERLDALEQELHQLRRSMNNPQPASATADEDLAPSDRSSFRSPSPKPSQPSKLPRTFAIDSEVTSQSFAGVMLDPPVIKELLEEFYEKHYPRFPILQEDPDSIFQTHKSCPFLFWTVIAIALRESLAHNYLFEKVSTGVSDMIKYAHNHENRSLEVVQGLLLHCVWPFPYGPKMEDKTWSYCGLATHMALQLGIHRPVRAFDFSTACNVDYSTLSVRANTWVGCFIVNHGISSSFGLPCTIPLESVTIHIAAPSSHQLPAILDYQLRIAILSVKSLRILGQNEQTVSGLAPQPYSVIRLFEADFNNLEKRYGGEWDAESLMYFLCAKLQLYSFAFFTDEPQEDNSIQSEFTAMVYNTAIILVKSLISIAKLAPFCTANTRFSLYYGCFFLLKIYPSFKKSSPEAQEIVAKIDHIVLLLRRNAPVRYSHLKRVASLFEWLNKDNQTIRSMLSSDLRVRCRMAANLIFEMVGRAKVRLFQAPYEDPWFEAAERRAREEAAAAESARGEEEARAGTGQISDGGSSSSINHQQFQTHNQTQNQNHTAHHQHASNAIAGRPDEASTGPTPPPVSQMPAPTAGADLVACINATKGYNMFGPPPSFANMEDSVEGAGGPASTGPINAPTPGGLIQAGSQHSLDYLLDPYQNWMDWSWEPTNLGQ